MNGAEEGYVNESKESSEAGISEMMAKPKPGVTVKIVAVSEHYWAWWLSLDGIHNDLFGAQSDLHFESPEAAETDCRKHLGELVDRLFPGGVMLASTHGFSMELQNLKFVRE